MKKIFGLVIVLVTLLTINVSCQNLESKDRDGKQHINNMNQKLKSELDLNDKQEKSWDEIHKNYTTKVKGLRNDDSLDREDKKEKVKNLFTEMDKEVLAILNDEQKKEYTELVKQNRGNAKAKYQNRQAEYSGHKEGQNDGQNIKSELNLSEDQSEKWDKINLDYRSKMQGLRNNNELNSDAKRTDMVNLMGEKDAEILAILDSEQQANYLQMVDERRTRAKEKKGKNQ